MESRATQSVRVPVKNLQKYDPAVNVNQLQVCKNTAFQALITKRVDLDLSASCMIQTTNVSICILGSSRISVSTDKC